MTVAARLKQFLSSFRIRYQMFSHGPVGTLDEVPSALNIPINCFACSVILKDSKGYMLAVIPLNRQLDLALVNQRLKRELKPVSNNDADALFFDCEPGTHPPLGEPYGLSAIIDSSLLTVTHVYFEPGSHNAVLRMTQEDFRFIATGAVWAQISSPSEVEPKEALGHTRELLDDFMGIELPSLDQMCRLVQEVYPMPGLSGVAKKLLALIKQSVVSEQELIQIVNSDSISMHLLNAGLWLQLRESSQLRSFNTSVSAQMLLGMSAGRDFHLQKSGPLGFDSFWEHAFLTAILMEELSTLSTIDFSDSRPFLTGLMHNFGFLLFGHWFRPEFKLLNNMIKLYPEASIVALEKKILGLGQARQVLEVGHAQMGSWMLQHWGFPESVVAVAQAHHQSDYHGPYSELVKLMRLSNSLLKEKGIGDGCLEYWTSPQLNELGLDSNILDEALMRTFAQHSDMEPLLVGTSP